MARQEAAVLEAQRVKDEQEAQAAEEKAQDEE